MMKFKIKEPRKITAIFLIMYMMWATHIIIDNFSKKTEKLESITGLGSGQVAIMLYPQCNIRLNPELNLVSLCANSTNKSIKKVLEPIAGQYDFVLHWNSATQNFETFSPEAADDANEFAVFEINQSYFIFMNRAATLGISGNAVDDINISLGEEYNAPSYPYLFTANISKYLSKIIQDVSFVLKWNSTTQQFDAYSPEAAENPFVNITKGEGQMVYMLAANVLRYNKTALQP